jgi:hypothetical protein
MAVYDLNKMRPDYLTRQYRRKVATGESLTLARLEAKQGSITPPRSRGSNPGLKRIVAVSPAEWLCDSVSKSGLDHSTRDRAFLGGLGRRSSDRCLHSAA